jgi:hypothetical protein
MISPPRGLRVFDGCPLTNVPTASAVRIIANIAASFSSLLTL